MSIGSVSKVLALAEHHMRVSPCECDLCEIPEDIIAQARAELDSLHLSNDELLEAVSRISLPLRDAAVLRCACSLDVGYEAAAVLAVKSAGRWNGTAELTLRDILDACTKRGSRPPGNARGCPPHSSRCGDDTPVDGARPSPCGDGTPVDGGGLGAG